MKNENLPTLETLVQITPVERAEFYHINAEVTNTFNFIFALYDLLENEDREALLPFLEDANTLAEKLKTLLLDEVSNDEYFPQTKVAKILRTAGELHTQLQNVKFDLEKKMQALGYEINVNTVEETESEPVPDLPKEEVLLASEAAPVPTTNLESVPSLSNEKIGEPISELEALTMRYKMADESVFQIADGSEKPKRKPFKEIRTELKDIFTAQRYGEYGTRFLAETVDTVGKKISALNIYKKSEKNWQRREEANRLINGLYSDLLQDIAVFMQTVKVDIEEGVLPTDAQPEEGSEEIKKDIAAATETFKSLSEQIPADSQLRQTPEFLATAQAVGAVNDYHEEDPVRAATDLQHMNKVLQKSFNKLLPLLVETQNATTTSELDSEVTETAMSEFAVLEAEVPKTNNGAEEVRVEEVEVKTEQATSEKMPDEDSVVVEAQNPKNDFVEKYHSNRTEWKEAKQVFREKEVAYQAALSEYFQADNWKAKLRSGLFNTKKLIGLNPELPPALETLRAEYQTLRSFYAESLDAVLKERSEADLENKEYEMDSDTTKAAFASKFILKPSQKILSLQERAILNPEQQAKLGRVMAVLAKHKWLTRVGMVTAAGVVGGLSGGIGLAAAGASWQASKITLSAGASAGAAYATKRGMQGRVDKASNTLTEAETAANSEFTLDNLNTLDATFAKALSSKKLAERQQKTATIAAAIAAGGAVGFTAGSFGQAEAVAPFRAESATVAEDLSRPELNLQDPETIAAEISPVKIAEIRVSSEGNSPYEYALSNISFGTASNAEALSSVEQAELTSFLKLKADDLLSAHPNMAEARLESELFKSVQNKFGTTDWWGKATISEVDIGKFEFRALASSVPEVAPVVNEAPAVYTIAKGDTLIEVVQEKFAENLKDLTPAERSTTLDALFDKIQSNPELKIALGLRSGDVDLIYAGEKLNLAVLEGELDTVLERNEIVEQFTRSAPVAITPDVEAQTIPITVVEKPIIGGTEINLGNTSYTEATPSVTETLGSPLVPPRPFALSGQYSEQPEYREYITKVFGNGKAFEQAVERAVKNLDNGTYDIFERSPLFGGVTYESPYRLLGEMSLEEVKEFEAQTNDEIRYFLSQNNIKYDTYLTWLDQIDKMAKTLPNVPATKVTDLFSRYIAEHDYLVAH